MQAVVLAAGEGTRMRPLTETRPKPMLPVAGQPLVEHVLDACHPHVDGIVLIVGYRADVIRERIGETYRGTPVTYVTQEKQLGTGHAVAAAEPHVSDPFLVLNGDVLVDPALVGQVADAGPAGMAVKPVADPSNYGVIRHEDDRVTAIIEKPEHPPSDLANLGVYLFPPEAFVHLNNLELSPRGEYEITDAVDALVQSETPVTAVEYGGYWIDCGRPWELLDANATLLADQERRLEGDIADGSTIRGSVVVGPAATVEPSSVVDGPVRAQAGAQIGSNATIHGPTVIGPDTTVEAGAVVEQSILMDGVTVGQQASVDSSILGSGTTIGPGTQVTATPSNNGTVWMTVKGERVDTGRQTLGLVAGDGVRTGANATLDAGIKFGARERTAPGEVVTRDRSDR